MVRKQKPFSTRIDDIVACPFAHASNISRQKTWIGFLSHGHLYGCFLHGPIIVAYLDLVVQLVLNYVGAVKLNGS